VGKDDRADGLGRRPTSKDVAEVAGVSRATVSYVLNGVDEKHRIAPATRDRVLDAAQGLGYEPNAVALALRAGRTEIVLVEMPNWPLGPPVAAAINALVETLEELGYTPLVHFQRRDPSRLARAGQRLHPVGLIAPGPQLSPEMVTMMHGLGARAVLAIHQRPLPHVFTYVIEQSRMGGLAVEHLADRGHRRVLVLMPDDPILRRLAELRTAGAVAAAKRRRIALRTVTTHVRREAVESTIAATVGRSERETAIYAFNDEQALVALEALRDQGVAVPQEMAVIGCDDSSAAEQFRPRLTTMRFDARDRWHVLARQLHAMITGEGEPRGVIEAEPAVVQGETT
jgi:DNA-binding LacI/PurR family transcriptional regulator